MTEITADAPDTEPGTPDPVLTRAAGRFARSLATRLARIPRRLLLLAVPGALTIGPLTDRLGFLCACGVLTLAYVLAFVIFYARKNMTVYTGDELTGDRLDAAREAAQNPKRVQREPVDL